MGCVSSPPLPSTNSSLRREAARTANGEGGMAGPVHSLAGSPAGSDTHATPSVGASALSAWVDDEDGMVGGRGGARATRTRRRSGIG